MSTTDQTLVTASDPQGEREKSRRLAERYRCGFVDLFEQRIDPELFRSIPAELMFRFNFVPMEAQGAALVIAVADPSQVLLSDELGLLLGKKLILKVATPTQISDLLKRTEQSQRVLDQATEAFTLTVVEEDEESDSNISADGLTQQDSFGEIGLKRLKGFEAAFSGGDYFGLVLNRAARVMSAGHGGQILLDGPTAALLTNVELVELGQRRLRDIAKPVALFQVCAPGLQADFPPLKTVDPVPGNLRPATTSFIGRKPDIAELEILLGTHPLVTLTGPGGVGKTRLALESASRLAHTFVDGVWVIELGAITDAGAVPEAVAAVLGITQQPGTSLSESVAAALEGRARLLIFDNCEHVLDAAAELVEAILTRAATVKILATSREGLHVAAEQLRPVFVELAGLSARKIAAALNERQIVTPTGSAWHAATVIRVQKRLGLG